MAVAAATLLVGSGLGFGLAGGSLHALSAQAEAKKHEAGGSLLLLIKRGDASLFAALEQK